ncbi:MAG TPA: DUF2894 domain-containing protein [Dyella sp.]|uniref:DUF2894 domain-containing protein n=1 Tax=Dyella sp. TaxID=1869338 RepID=UPI002D792D8B|nr:DUF2894 domain-containing protein [Dyella sp.]HET6555363.1 DUF2894 domain-containing protein [Dyella sp.]
MLPARARIEAWREQRADRLDPLRFHLIDALEKRVSAHAGEARCLLDERLAGLLDTYAADLEAAALRASHADSPADTRDTSLKQLVDDMARDASTKPRDINGASGHFTEPAMLDTFRQIWAGLRAESQLRQSLKRAPTNAGPLNSGALVHRSIGLMRDLSPGYLQHFLSYIDDLSWLEQLSAGRVTPVGDATQATAPRKRTRSKARPRSD